MKKLLVKIKMWTNNFLKNQKIILFINSNSTASFPVATGISQNSSLFFIVYLFYNADLLKACNKSGCKVTPMGFVNDINL